MNEALQRIHLIEQQADELYKVWRKHLDKFGHRDDYWDRVIAQSNDFDREHDFPLCRHYAGTVIASRVSALEDEWRKGRNENGS